MLRHTCALLLLVALPSSALAQESPPASAQGSVDLTLGLTSIAGNGTGTVGGRLWIHLNPQWRVGASGLFALQNPDGGDLEGSGLEAAFGRGGAVVGFDPGLIEGVEVRFLAGIGSVALSDRVTGNTVDTEAFWTLEPSVGWTALRSAPFSAGVEAGYRFVFGADDLTRLVSSDLQSPYLSLFGSLSLF